jgi:hypothetical protein
MGNSISYQNIPNFEIRLLLVTKLSSKLDAKGLSRK